MSGRMKKQTQLKHIRTTYDKMCSPKKAEKHSQRGRGAGFGEYKSALSFLQVLKVENLFFELFLHPSALFMDDFPDSRSLLSPYSNFYSHPAPPNTITWRLRLMLCMTFLGPESRDCRMMTAFGRDPEWKIYSLPCRCLVRWAAASPHPL